MDVSHPPESAEYKALRAENRALRAENERLTNRCRDLETLIVTQAELDAQRCQAPA